METHGTGSKFSTLDWPSPEILRAARRARTEALRDMTWALWRNVKSLRLLAIFETGIKPADAGKTFFDLSSVRSGAPLPNNDNAAVKKQPAERPEQEGGSTSSRSPADSRLR